MTDDDTERLREIGRALPAPELDASTADRIARAVHRRPSLRPVIEAAFVVLVASGLLAWTLYKICEVYRW